MSEEKYFEKDFRWERGLYRAPNGILLLNALYKYYVVPKPDIIRKKQKIFNALDCCLLIGMILAIPAMAFSIHHPKIGDVLLLICLALTTSGLISLFVKDFYLRRGLKRVDVISAGFLDRAKLGAQRTPYWMSISGALLLIALAFFTDKKSTDGWNWLLAIFGFYGIALAYLRWKQNKIRIK